MTNKKVVELPVEDVHNDVKSFILLGILEGVEQLLFSEGILGILCGSGC